MQLLRHPLAAVAFVFSLCLFPIAFMALAWPNMPLVESHGCFWSPNYLEKIVLYPIQEHPLTLTLVTRAVLLLGSLKVAADMARWAMEAWTANRKPAISTTEG